jgi:hypothetical protein
MKANCSVLWSLLLEVAVELTREVCSMDLRPSRLVWYLSACAAGHSTRLLAVAIIIRSLRRTAAL